MGVALQSLCYIQRARETALDLRGVEAAGDGGDLRPTRDLRGPIGQPLLGEEHVAPYLGPRIQDVAHVVGVTAPFLGEVVGVPDARQAVALQQPDEISGAIVSLLDEVGLL